MKIGVDEIYRTLAIKGRSQLEAAPLRFQAKIKFVYHFHVIIWGSKTVKALDGVGRSDPPVSLFQVIAIVSRGCISQSNRLAIALTLFSTQFLRLKCKKSA